MDKGQVAETPWCDGNIVSTLQVLKIRAELCRQQDINFRACISFRACTASNTATPLGDRLAGISTAQSDRVHKDKTIEKEKKILEESPS